MTNICFFFCFGCAIYAPTPLPSGSRREWHAFPCKFWFWLRFYSELAQKFEFKNDDDDESDSSSSSSSDRAKRQTSGKRKGAGRGGDDKKADQMDQRTEKLSEQDVITSILKNYDHRVRPKGTNISNVGE